MPSFLIVAFLVLKQFHLLNRKRKRKKEEKNTYSTLDICLALSVADKEMEREGGGEQSERGRGAREERGRKKQRERGRRDRGGGGGWGSVAEIASQVRQLITHQIIITPPPTPCPHFCLITSLFDSRRIDISTLICRTVQCQSFVVMALSVSHKESCPAYVHIRFLSLVLGKGRGLLGGREGGHKSFGSKGHCSHRQHLGLTFCIF